MRSALHGGPGTYRPQSPIPWADIGEIERMQGLIMETQGQTEDSAYLGFEGIRLSSVVNAFLGTWGREKFDVSIQEPAAQSGDRGRHVSTPHCHFRPNSHAIHSYLPPHVAPLR